MKNENEIQLNSISFSSNMIVSPFSFKNHSLKILGNKNKIEIILN